MDKLCIITNVSKDKDLKITKECERILKDSFNLTFSDGLDAKKTLEALDGAIATIVIGGDGTILKASSYAVSKNVPILGINMGNLGFLADVELSELESALLSFKNGDYNIERRFMIEANIQNGKTHTLCALNDIVVSRASYTRMVGIDVFIDDTFLSSFVGDGVCISTPTGSTAYSLSAGGPIIEPGLDLFLITPICPHTMNSKPIIVSKDAVLKLKLNPSFCDKSLVTSDGQASFEVNKDSIIEIKKSNLKTKLIKISQRSFYEIVHKKLQ